MRINHCLFPQKAIHTIVRMFTRFIRISPPRLEIRASSVLVVLLVLWPVSVLSFTHPSLVSWGTSRAAQQPQYHDSTANGTPWRQRPIQYAQYASRSRNGMHKSSPPPAKSKSRRQPKFDVSHYSIANQVPRGTNTKKQKSKAHPSDQQSTHTTSPKPLRNPSVRRQLDYARNGHTVLRNLLNSTDLHHLHATIRQYTHDEELAAWRQKVHVASGAHSTAKSCPSSVADCQRALRRLWQLDEDATLELPFLQHFHVWRSLPEVLDLAKALAPVAAEFLDVPSVRLYQDSVFDKRAGDGPTPWHVDAKMAPFDSSHFVTFWIPLNDVYESGLVFGSKSHADFALPFWNPPGDGAWTALEDRYSEERLLVDYMPILTGDVTVHSGWTLHCTNGGSTEDRLALAISFVDACAPVRANAMEFHDNMGDAEDAWSYQDWIHEVPRNCKEWNHPSVPILWWSSDHDGRGGH